MAIVWFSLNILLVLMLILVLIAFWCSNGCLSIVLMVLIIIILIIIHYWFLFSTNLQQDIIHTFGKTFYEYIKWRMIIH